MTSHKNGPEHYDFILEPEQPVEESYTSTFTPIKDDETIYGLDVHLRIAIDSTVELFQNWLENYRPIDWSHFDQQDEYVFYPTAWDISLLPDKRVSIFRGWQISPESIFLKGEKTARDLLVLQELNNSLHDWMTIDITSVATERLELTITFHGNRFLFYFQELIRYMALLWPSVNNGHCSFSALEETTVVSEFLEWSPERDTVEAQSLSSIPETQIDGEISTSHTDDSPRPYFAYPKLDEVEAIGRLAKAKVGLEIKEKTKFQWAEIQRKVDWSYGDTAESRKKLYEDARKKYKSLAEQKNQYADLYTKVEARAKELWESQEGKAGS